MKGVIKEKGRKEVATIMDKDLLQNILNGDKESFKSLYDEHIHHALRTAFAITKNREMAKDAVQETFIRVYLNLSSYNINKPFKPWFYRILINECNRLLKKGTTFQFADPSLLEEDRIAGNEKESFHDLHDAIDSLKDIYRIPVILKYLQGFSEKEISKILNLNLNTVKSRLFKGREKLKMALEIIEKGRESHE
jgi:RNA polymerase sigma factor (sigma-70 family)